MFDFNKDMETREQILFGEKYDEENYKGGTRYFEGISTETVQKLMELKFLDPEETQNDSPTAKEMLEFAEQWGEYTFDGYAVSLKRPDYRVNLTTISKESPSGMDELQAFIKKFRYADEFDTDGSLYAWYD